MSSSNKYNRMTKKEKLQINSVSMNPTPPQSGFTPINQPPKPERKDVFSPSHLVASDYEEGHDVSLEESSFTSPNRNLKRDLAAREEVDGHSSKRQMNRLATPSNSPFQTLRVTNSSSVSSRTPYSKTKDTQSYHDASHEQSTGPRSLGWTTMDQLTPYPTRGSYGPRDQLNQNVKFEPVNGSDTVAYPLLAHGQVLLPPATTSTTWTINSTQDQYPSSLSSILSEHCTTVAHFSTTASPTFRHDAGRSDEDGAKLVGQHVDTVSDPDDEYPLDEDLIDEDMSGLLDCQEKHIPPSSVTMAWDHDSRSAADYDPNLQYSSPPGSEALKGLQAVDTTAKLEADQDLLDDDVDWNTVYAITEKLPKGASTMGSHNMPDALRADQVQVHDAKNTIQQTPLNEDTAPLNPFPRPPFPEKVRDRPVVPGISSDIIMRTCFRMGEVVNQAVRCLTNQQDVVFELFARVTYSSRESLAKRQHFQFVDLFKDQQPYPSGTLTNWRTDSLIDRQSMIFLDKSTGRKLCRCLCKPKRDPKTEVGFTLIVLSVREADWTQVKWAKKIVCGDS